MSSWKIVFLSATALLLLSISAASTGWLNKEPWQDRPLYAEDISVSISPTDLIQERGYREVCTNHSNTTLENGSTVTTCDTYENETYPGSNIGVFNVTGGDAVYLGNGYVRANVTVELNELSKKTLKEALYLMGETEYLDWFNSNYLYNGANMTASELSSLQSRVQDLSATGTNTGIVASRVNSIDLESGSTDMTMVFRFNSFRSGILSVSDLLQVEVESDIAEA